MKDDYENCSENQIFILQVITSEFQRRFKKDADILSNLPIYLYKNIGGRQMAHLGCFGRWNPSRSSSIEPPPNAGTKW